MEQITAGHTLLDSGVCMLNRITVATFQMLYFYKCCQTLYESKSEPGYKPNINAYYQHISAIFVKRQSYVLHVVTYPYLMTIVRHISYVWLL